MPLLVRNSQRRREAGAKTKRVRPNQAASSNQAGVSAARQKPQKAAQLRKASRQKSPVDRRRSQALNPMANRLLRLRAQRVVKTSSGVQNSQLKALPAMRRPSPKEAGTLVKIQLKTQRRPPKRKRQSQPRIAGSATVSLRSRLLNQTHRVPSSRHRAPSRHSAERLPQLKSLNSRQRERPRPRRRPRASGQQMERSVLPAAKAPASLNSQRKR